MIASHYDFTKGDAAWPSNKTLARETGLSVRSITRARKLLTECQYLSSQRQYNNVTLSIPTVPESIPCRHKGQLNTHINTHINTKEIHKEIQSNSNEFDNSINQIITGDIIDVSSETIASGTALKKEQTPAENYIPESLREKAKIWD